MLAQSRWHNPIPHDYSQMVREKIDSQTTVEEIPLLATSIEPESPDLDELRTRRLNAFEPNLTDDGQQDAISEAISIQFPSPPSAPNEPVVLLPSDDESPIKIKVTRSVIFQQVLAFFRNMVEDIFLLNKNLHWTI